MQLFLSPACDLLMICDQMNDMSGVIGQAAVTVNSLLKDTSASHAPSWDGHLSKVPTVFRFAI